MIYNTLGFPIFGSNPTIERISPSEILASSTNCIIQIEIIEPKLSDGDYRLGVWFGDSKQNYFVDTDFLTFSVVGMSTKKQFPSSIVGSVLPTCNWRFT